MIQLLGCGRRLTPHSSTLQLRIASAWLPLADPAFIDYKQRGLLQLNEKLWPVLPARCQQKRALYGAVGGSARSGRRSAIKGVNYLELFQLVRP